MFIQIYSSTSPSTRNTVSSIIFIIIVILIALLIYYLLSFSDRRMTIEDLIIMKHNETNPADLTKLTYLSNSDIRFLLSEYLKLPGEVGKITIYNNTSFGTETKLKIKNSRRRGLELNTKNALVERNTDVKQQVNFAYSEAFLNSVHTHLAIMITNYVRAYDFVLKTLIRHCGIENAYPLARTALSKIIHDTSILGSNMFGNETEEGWLTEEKIFVYLGPPIVTVTKHKTKI
jgi:hypothetical protein